MSAPPLTHHEILGVVEPFTRRGRHLDLAASDRLGRRLVFKAVDHAGLRETLQLECPTGADFSLTRVLALPGGLQARLVTAGPRPDDLLARIESIPLQRQFDTAGGCVIAHSHRLEPTAAAAGAGAATPTATRLMLTQGEALVDGLRVTLKMPTVKNSLADLLLGTAAGDPLALPEDLLAVLGWAWARLTRVNDGWTSCLRLRGKGSDLGLDGERKLQKTVEHLARTLGEPPGRFHDRLARARWAVVLRRAFPLLASIGLIAGAASVSRLQLAEGSVIQMLVFQSPPLLLLLVFCMREMPRIEIPPWPRRSAAPAWRPAPAALTAPQDVQDLQPG